MTESDRETRDAALALTQAVADFLADSMGKNLLGFYLLGSLAHGGFNRRYSDIDVGLITENGVDDAALEAIRAEAAKISPVLAPKLSIFWANRDFTTGRFPPLDRLDYLDNGVPLFERERIAVSRPTLSDVRTYLRGPPFENWAANTRTFADLTGLTPENHKPYLRVHLYPARFAFSWLTGKMASNDDAVAYLLENTPDGLDMDLISRALEIRHAAADPDALFEDRTALSSQVTACARLMR